MGFFRKKKGAPLSSIMYQSDNTTPARRQGKSVSLTPDTIEEDPAALKTKQGLFKSKKKQKEHYVKVTPDKKDESNRSDEHQEQNMSEKTALIVPSMSSGAAALSMQPQSATNASIPALINESDASIPVLMTPDQHGGLPTTTDEKMEVTKRNLHAAFEDSCEANELDETNYVTNTAASKEHNKFLKRFRASWRKSPSKEQKAIVQKLIEQQNMEKASPVPKVVIDRKDEGSVPSLITEMTGRESFRKAAAAVADSDDGIAVQPQTFFGPVESFSTTSNLLRQPRQESTLGERFLNLLQCGDDTTSDGYFGRIKCLDFCGPIGEKDVLRLQNEEDARFVIQFMNEISKQGIKLIHHQSPSPNDPSSDWTQLTIKMFLRSGNCHDLIEHPALAWATLPVASRKILTGSYDIEESRDKEEWTQLSLWDIYSIMGAEDTEDLPNTPDRSKHTQGANTIQSEADSRGDTYTRDTASYTHTKGTTFDEDGTTSASGFFSITAGSDGNVYVFEAPTGRQRDYIVKGLKKLIRRASKQLIAGKLDVCAELYGEDAAPLSGELPSLVTPTQALGRVTHSFLDDV